MSAFNNNSVTLKGATIIASLVTGSTLTFTRIAVGDGTLASGQTALTRERLVNPLFNVPISSVESNNAAQAVVKGTFSNADLNTGFYYREIGLFAINPETNAEELFLYGNAGTEAEWINPAGQSSLIEKEIHLVTLIGNASNVTAVFDENAKVLKSEFDAIVPLKADLDAKPENGGRVVANQMRFDEVQTLYVDAAATNGGDGTQAKPFKTITAAVAAYYPGARNVIIRIKPGTYPENIEINYASGSYWQILRDGTGNVVVNSLSAHGILLYLKDLSFTGSVTNVGVLAANCPVVTMDNITVNGNANVNGLQFYNTATFLSNVKINSCANAVVARDNSRITVNGISGTGNVVGVFSGESIVTINSNTMQANTPYTRINGGTIDPASWQIIDDSKTSINTLPSGIYSLKNAKVEQGLPENYDGTLLVDQSTGTPHMIYFFDGENRMLHRSYDKQGGYWREWEDYIPETPTASAATFGLIRTTSVEDEQNCQCDDAAVTPESLYKLSDYRRANTAYQVGDVVACPYHVEFLLKCTQAGKTSDGALDTTNVTKGQVLTDGGVKWTVVAKAIIDASISGKNITLTFADGSTKTLTTQDNGYHTGNASAIGGASATNPAVVVASYRSGNNWYRKYSDGFIIQGGIYSNQGAQGEVTITLPIAFATTNYTVVSSHGYNSYYNTGGSILFDQVWGLTKTSFKAYCGAKNSGTGTEHRLWIACGV